jgi:transcriptional regulator with XRE-family HTH domain
MRSKTVDRLLKSTPKDIAFFVDWYADLQVRINYLLHEKGISQKKLAEQMGKKPSEISKWLNGEHNFTLRSLARLSAELGEPLLHIPKCPAHTKFTSGHKHSIRTFISIEDSKKHIHSQEHSMAKISRIKSAK